MIRRDDDDGPARGEGISDRRRGQDDTSVKPRATRANNRDRDYNDYDHRYRRRGHRGYYGGYHDHSLCYSGYSGYGYSDYGYSGSYSRYSPPYYSGSHHWHYNPYYSYFGSFSFWYPYWYFPNVYLEIDAGYDGAGGSGGGEGYSARVGGIGAIDTDVSPEKALIFVDGRQVGDADDFDGFPDKLWLEEGTYDIAIYHPGYETIFRQYTVYPGLVIDVEDRMTPGDALHPDDHGPTTTARRDARIEQDRQRAEAVRRSESPPGSDSKAASGRLLLDLWPADAAVYLDGNFLGTAAEVSQLSAGLVVTSGEHQIEVTRPGFEDRQVTVNVADGERQELVIELKR